MISVYSINNSSKLIIMRPKYINFKDITLESNTCILALYKTYNYNIVLESEILLSHYPIYNLLKNKLKVLQEYNKILNKKIDLIFNKFCGSSHHIYSKKR